jgi:hypothetical protein
MEAKSVEELPAGAAEGGARGGSSPSGTGFAAWCFATATISSSSPKGEKPLGRYFPELVERFRGVPADRFVIDGELVIPINGALSFDALQMRLHPAESRVRRLAKETPAKLILFDCLAADGRGLREAPLTQRRPRRAGGAGDRGGRPAPLSFHP